MGILNSKHRIFDTILTREGKRQLAEGKLRPQYYSFSDRSAIYHKDTIISGGLDETFRPITEASNLPQDVITFEADEEGYLRGFLVSGSEGYTAINGKVFSINDYNEGYIKNAQQIQDDSFASLVNELFEQSADAFKNQFLLTTPDSLELDDLNETPVFEIDKTNLKFVRTNNAPFIEEDITSVSLDDTEGFFQDARFSNVENFMFLPPVSKAAPGSTQKFELGNYLDLNQIPMGSYEGLHKNFLNKYINSGQKKTIEFLDRPANIMSQMFEISGEQIKKLDILKFNLPLEDKFLEKSIFFVGKVLIDDYNQPKFIHMFTLIFE